MKVCTKCGEPKSLAGFAKRTASRDGLANWCKSCFADNAAKKYQSDPEERARKIRNRDKFRKENQQRILEYLTTHPCVDCGIADVRVLEFDHRDLDEKQFNIASMYASYSWEAILAEINKCDVRCANHHRIRTAQQFGTWRAFIGM